MKEMDSKLRHFVHENGIRGTLLLIFFNYGFFSFVINLVDLTIAPEMSPFGGTWGVLLFSIGMASIWLKWPFQPKINKGA